MNTLDIGLFASTSSDEPRTPEPTVDVDFDCLALSVTNHNRDNSMGGTATQISNVLHDKNFLKHIKCLDEIDSIEADKIRKYYRDRLSMAMLKGTISRFRSDLYTYVTQPRNHISSEQIGMVAKLPLFYYEDTALDEIDKTVKQPTIDRHMFDNTRVKKTLSFLCKTYSNHRMVRLFFKDEDGMLCNITDEAKNQFLPLFEQLATQGPLTIKCEQYIQRLRGRETTYYSIRNWTVVQ